MKISLSLFSLSIITGILLCILKACNILTASWVLVCIPFYIAGGIILMKLLLTIFMLFSQIIN